jgi:cardiolipin synthase C
MRRVFAAFAATVLLTGGCAPGTRSPAMPSMALAPSPTSALGRELASVVREHPGQSGFHLINDGREAFLTRTVLAGLAERTIDAQYFIWDADATGTLLLNHLIRAADRGVRVRLLVDDMYIKGRDAGIAAIDAHPNVEIRIYNPIGGRNKLALGRRLDFLTKFGRLNHRMHNKLFVVDNEVVVMGGRNIADAYFGVDPKIDYRDMDIVATGPVVQRLSTGFDAYWNSRWATPIPALRGPPSERELRRTWERLEREAARLAASYPYAGDVPEPRAALRKLIEGLTWAPGDAVWADPESGPSQAQASEPTAVSVALTALMDTARSELVAVSPYLVANVDMPLVRRVRARGVVTRLLTNSLASTDEPPAYAVYARDRRAMLELGVDLYEIRPDAASRRRYIADPAGAARLALHAKVAVLDRRIVYVGSFNFDPRSQALNTEVALLVDSPVLARRLLDLLALDFEPDNSWRVVLDADDHRVAWLAEDSGQVIAHEHPPATSLWRRFKARVVGWLPIRPQL